MGFIDKLQQESSFSTASGNSYQYVVLQVTLKEKLFGTGSGNLTELEDVINKQAQRDTGFTLFPPPTAEARGLEAETASRQRLFLKN